MNILLINHYAGSPSLGMEFRPYYMAREWLKMEHQTATVELAADHFGFNRDYFGRYFKSRFGMTFGDFYKSLQIGYAKRLLGTGQFKVLEVSRLLGFSTPDYFTRVFKKHTGSTPSALRK